MLTDFGKKCRMIRLDANENLGDMAERLGVKSSFLSAVENGKKNVPKGFCEKIKEKYEISNAGYKELLDAAENSRRQVKIQMDKLNSNDRNLVLSFARKFEELESKEKQEIMKILKR